MNIPSRNEIWKMFDQISSTYDSINKILSLGMDRSWRKKAASHLPKKSPLQILDLATGTADQLIALFDHSSSIEKAIGIDLSEEMLSLGRKKIEQKPYRKKIKLIKADAEKLPFKNESFDAATFSFGIRNVASPITALKEIHRVLKPKGVAIILEFALPSYPWRWGHLFYLRHILPRLGALFSKNKEAYTYLNRTIETFPQGPSFCRLLEEAQFQQVKMDKMGLGAVICYLGEKA